MTQKFVKISAAYWVYLTL